MTRFARAKGSKSSNERKPEEATSWSEMRNSMLAKKPENKPEKLSNSTLEEPIKSNGTEKTEWASLGDDNGSGSSLLKRNSMKKNTKEVKNEKKKMKRCLSDSEKEGNPARVNESKGEKKAAKDARVDVEKKKGKKRKSTETEGDSEIVPERKKKKKAEPVEEKEQEKAGKKDKVNKQIVNKQIQSRKFKKGKEIWNTKTGKDNKFGKKFKSRNSQERNSGVEELIINGEKIEITKFQGFFVTLEDAERLKKLRSEMIREGIPRNKLEAAIKLERRRAEKALSRLKKSVCFHCRGHGHLLSNCPKLVEAENTGTGICYKCGSTEHSAVECKVVRGSNYQFAECFICKEQGHIARQCPDNPRGLYPQGGGCRECGDVTHLRKDCPKVQAQKAEEVVTVGLRSDRDLECLDEEITNREKQNTKKQVKKNSTVKF